jgi:hypothetical protein
MPNRAAQKVGASGMTTVPPFERSRKTRSASPTSVSCSDREKPFGAS